MSEKELAKIAKRVADKVVTTLTERPDFYGSIQFNFAGGKLSNTNTKINEKEE